MYVDIQKGTHVSSFPSKVASMMGQYGHVFNIVLQANCDNGKLALRGDYVSFDQYEESDVTDNANTGIIRELGADGRWIVEFTALEGEVLYLYNSPVSEYPEKEFQDEALMYNKAGERIQGATLIVGDMASYSDLAFTGTPQAGKAVKYAAGKFVVQP